MNPLSSLRLRPAEEADVPFLLDLRGKAMGAHYEALGLAPDVEHLEARVRAGFEVAQIIEVEGQAVGLIKVQRPPAEWHVMQLQVLPSAQGRGIGSALLRALLDEAGRAGVAMTLSVLKVNRARRLYERLGFVVTGEAGGDGYHMRAEPKLAESRPCA